MNGSALSLSNVRTDDSNPATEHHETNGCTIKSVGYPIESIGNPNIFYGAPGINKSLDFLSVFL